VVSDPLNHAEILPVWQKVAFGEDAHPGAECSRAGWHNGNFIDGFPINLFYELKFLPDVQNFFSPS
jgi:hypothetical protein